MARVNPLQQLRPEPAGHGGWSPRRTAAVVLLAGAIFWSIIIFIAMRLGYL